jgi:hypothetical protein
MLPRLMLIASKTVHTTVKERGVQPPGFSPPLSAQSPKGDDW